VSFLESGLTVETKVKPDSRKDTLIRVAIAMESYAEPGIRFHCYLRPKIED